MAKLKSYDEYNSLHCSYWGLFGPYLASALFTFLVSIVATIASQSIDVVSNWLPLIYFANIATELCFIFVALGYSKYKNISFVKATELKTNTKWYIYLLIPLFAFVTIILFNQPIAYWEQFLIWTGYNLSTQLSMPLDNLWQLLLALVCSAVFPAVCEEFLFRGMILSGLRKFGAFTSIGFSSIIFALMHGNLQQLPYTLILGIILGAIFYYTRNIWLTILFHFTNNAISIITLYFMQNTADLTNYSSAVTIIESIILGLAGVVLTIVGIKYLASKQNNAETLSIKEFLRKKEFCGVIIVGILLLIILTVVNYNK